MWEYLWTSLVGKVQLNDCWEGAGLIKVMMHVVLIRPEMMVLGQRREVILSILGVCFEGVTRHLVKGEDTFKHK